MINQALFFTYIYFYMNIVNIVYLKIKIFLNFEKKVNNSIKIFNNKLFFSIFLKKRTLYIFLKVLVNFRINFVFFFTKINKIEA